LINEVSEYALPHKAEEEHPEQDTGSDVVAYHSLLARVLLINFGGTLVCDLRGHGISAWVYEPINIVCLVVGALLVTCWRHHGFEDE
jgi:hypothetical protein